MEQQRLKQGEFYHIYNRGNNSRDLFLDHHDYEHFLGLYDRYISPIAETYGWVLMPNHFHFLVQTKTNIAYKYGSDDRLKDAIQFENHKWDTIDLSAGSRDFETDNVKQPVPHLHFSHLFNAYTKYFNKRYDAHGNLFERPFKRKLVDHSKYFRQLILYIHQNPVLHGFCSHPAEYPWSSYLSCVSVKPTHLKRDKVIGWFDDQANFKTQHHDIIESQKLEAWLSL